MALLKTSNPAFGQRTFQDGVGTGYGRTIDAYERMTLSGTVNKTGVLLVLAVASASWTWHTFLLARDPASVSGLMTLGLFGGFICALVTIFKMQWAAVTAPLYAVLEGLALGGISAMFEMRYPGIAMQAVGLTFGTLAVMLLAYKSGLIKVTDKLRMGVVAAMGGIMVVYLAEMVLGFFGVHFQAINGSGPVGILFSLVIVAVASLNLVLNFDSVEQGVRYGAPKYMEWYGAFGIMVSLVWLYLEILQLLSKARSRN